MLIISTVLSTIVRESIWFLQLITGIRENLANTHLSLNQYMDMFDTHGFQCVTAMNLLTTKGANIYCSHLDPEAPLDEDWRIATNFFDIATDLEIKEMESAILAMKQNGTLETFVRENDHTQERGFVTIFACISKTI